MNPIRPQSIPSPPSGTLSIGPLDLSAYGLMIAFGVVAATALAGRRLEARRAGTRDDLNAIAVPAVIAGVLGARLYHVLTSFDTYRDDLLSSLAIWKGGLGIPGGLIAGVLVGLIAVRRRGLDRSQVLAAAAPAIPLAQAIGRWGNWWNQELYGRATDLPWALEIAPEHLPAAALVGTTFHPTFLYESLWNLGVCAALLMIDRKRTLTGGSLLAIYTLAYSIGRFWIEGLRIDPATSLGPWRLNQWTAMAAAATATAYLIVRRHTLHVPAAQHHHHVPARSDNSRSA
jgi:prolipoprotein diacylglyceryl transferase